MPDSSRPIELLLESLQAAVAGSDMNRAEQLSKMLHGQVSNLDAQTTRSVLNTIAGILESAHRHRRALRDQLRQQRGTRQAVNVYQSAHQSPQRIKSPQRLRALSG